MAHLRLLLYKAVVLIAILHQSTLWNEIINFMLAIAPENLSLQDSGTWFLCTSGQAPFLSSSKRIMSVQLYPVAGDGYPVIPVKGFPFLSWATSEAFTLGSNCSSSRSSASDCGGWDLNPRLRVMNPARNHSSTPRYFRRVLTGFPRQCI